MADQLNETIIKRVIQHDLQQRETEHDERLLETVFLQT